MGVLYDYFHAADRRTAVERAIGPDGDWLSEARPREAGAGWLETKHTDPDVVVAKLVVFAEGIPSGGADRPELVWPDPDEVPYVQGTMPAAGTAWDSGMTLRELPDAWRDALAGVVEDALPMLALQWWDIEELDFADYRHAEGTVRDFVGLARRARTAGEHLYCRTIV
ncbi:hypothetical protein [Streptomyces sp. MMG1121]|uniref:hypothetical protein n=1 Tax=Streptomyces sp. MMG1121 TaxID=1415544 RepID=UPI0006AF8133|nr:hypothetical protein [Streptomyces sp. MMG1121]KOV69186.1 hypothetical protein ADK64_05510 [Streptomyces sp. MMG1121]